jgi:K+-sensing histidine kinase KdpD
MYRGKPMALAYLYDLRHMKRMTEELKKQSDLLRLRLGQQELISDISRSFVSSGKTQALIKEAVIKLGRHYKVSVVIIFSLDYKSDKANIEYYWSANGKPQARKKFNTHGLVKKRFPEKMYDHSSVPVFSCSETTTSGIKFIRQLSNIGINAFISAPLYVEGCLWGMMVAEQFHTPRQWTDDEKIFVSMAASTIAGAITHDIYNNKLKDAVKKETAASRAKSEFLSNMSHEIRTPMNAIINMAAIAKNSEENDQKNYALDKIEEASAHLLGIINDILDMSKIEANKFELMPVEFDFEKMIKRVVSVINFRIEEKKQKLFHECFLLPNGIFRLRDNCPF